MPEHFLNQQNTEAFRTRAIEIIADWVKKFVEHDWQVLVKNGDHEQLVPRLKLIFSSLKSFLGLTDEEILLVAKAAELAAREAKAIKERQTAQAIQQLQAVREANRQNFEQNFSQLAARCGLTIEQFVQLLNRVVSQL